MLRRLTTVLLTLGVCAPPAFAADTWTQPHPGVRLLRRTTTAPLRVFAAEVDLCAAGVAVRVTRPGEKRQRTSSFASAVGAEVAVNGDFFNLSTFTPTGLAVGDGVAWAETSDKSGGTVVAFGNDRVELPRQGLIVTPQPWMNDVVGGHPQVLRSGTVVDDVGALCTARHPRTAAGLSADGRTLFLVVVDGRSTASRGMLCSEVGALMKQLGANDAVNLDGGGSSTMWVRGQGVVNAPSDGSERVVGNHLAIRADGVGLPESCNEGWHDAVELPAIREDAATTDIDGDGDADVCARDVDGIVCAGGVTGPAVDGRTARFGDLDGNGVADLCAYQSGVLRCFIGDGAGWPTVVDGPDIDLEPAVYSTMRLADFTGDGLDDLCLRAAGELRCYPSTGEGFEAPIVGPAMPDADGWPRPSRFGTLRVGDIDGDGDQDLCARRAAGMACWPSEGAAFGAEIAGPAFSNADGWLDPSLWTTIRLADVDADGRADLCSRTTAGFECHLSTGAGFGPAVSGPPWGNGNGWADPENYASMALVDIDGDRDLDACARRDDGIVCHKWEGAAFGAAIAGPAMSDEVGWRRPEHGRTIRFADFDGDGRADVCGRASVGWRCWPSSGDGFGELVEGPVWSNAAGWNALARFATISMSGPRPRADEPSTPGDPPSGVDDPPSGGDDPAPGGAPVLPTQPDTNDIDDGPPDAAPLRDDVVTMDGGCACASTQPAESGWLVLAMFGLVAARISRRRACLEDR